MDHGRLRELEWQRDDLWRKFTAVQRSGKITAYLMWACMYEAACAELLRAL
jgi:hypothetical protein